MSNQFDTVIWQVGQRLAVDPVLIKAVIAAESNFDPRAYRKEAYVPHLQGPDASYGLMQTLYSTARELGYQGAPEGLFIPETSIEYGTRYLKKQILRYNGDFERAIAAYNAGTAYKNPDGSFKNQAYVSRVLGYYKRFKNIEGAQAGQFHPSTQWKTPGVPMPTQTPVRIQSASDGDWAGLSLESFMDSEKAPWLIGAATFFGLALLLDKRGR